MRPAREEDAEQRLEPGFLLADRYRLLTPVASGGMGQVWAAFDEALQRQVAVKVMKQAHAGQVELLERFRAEARFGAQISHPNVVAVYDFGEVDSLAFLVMELIDGPTLSALLQAQGVLEAHWVRTILIQLCSALAEAHAAGIIHRDIKPSNVLLAPDGVVKLMDFGIAHSLAEDSDTATGEVLGTAHYLSPEQARGEPATARSDLYALGVLAHELLTGAKPFAKDTPIATALAHLHEPPPPLPADVPADLAAVIVACLAKDPADRPASAAAMVLALAGENSEPSTAPLSGPLPRRLELPPEDRSLLQATARWTPVWKAKRSAGRLRSDRSRT